jgi:phytoene/squalene synthetase
MPQAPVTSVLAESYEFCDRIARRDKPHLYSASRYFVHEETRRAFASTYASMRVVDDLVDDIPYRADLNTSQRIEAGSAVEIWLEKVRATHAGDPADGPIWQALADTFSRFNLPIEPWQDLAVAMKSDIQTAHFEDWDHLRRYMRGASVAPAIVFMHLVLTRPAADGRRFVCPWTYERVATATADLAMFCYWVHILRDAAKDLSLGGGGLVYLPTADLAKFGLTVTDLRSMKEQKRASNEFRRLAEFEAERALFHLNAGQRHIPAIAATALPEHATALEALLGTYLSQLDWLREHDFDVFAASLELTDLAMPHRLPHD